VCRSTGACVASSSFVSVELSYLSAVFTLGVWELLMKEEVQTSIIIGESLIELLDGNEGLFHG